MLARKKQGFIQEELASLAQVTVRTIQRIESGESIPRSFTIKALARALKTNFEELTNETQNEGGENQPELPQLSSYRGNEKYFLQTLCLSCFSYLVIPFVHFLIPIYLLKKHNHIANTTLPLHSVTYIEGASSAQVERMLKAGIGGMTGNKLFLHYVLILDTKNQQFGVLSSLRRSDLK